MKRVLIAVDDSTASFEAARTAARLVAGTEARLRVLTVVSSASGDPATSRSLLEHVARDIVGAGVPRASIETVVRTGEPFRLILEEAAAWNADLIVMAVSDGRGLRSPYVGSETEHVLEFTDRPVLVVPGAHSVEERRA